MRGHRLNIFSERFKFVGLAVGPHKKFKYCCVVNFAVEYVEKKEQKKMQMEEEEEVFEDQLPMLMPQGDDEDEIYQEEYDEAAEWKGPGGFPYPIGVANKKSHPQLENKQPNRGNKEMFGFNQKRVEVKASLPPPGKPMMTFNKKKTSTETKKNGQAPPLTMKKNPNANKKKPKCKLMSRPIGRHESDEEVVEEVVHIKRKLTIESYNSDKEITAGNYACPVDDNQETEEFKGGGFDFKKKKQQSNNMYMKRGVNRNEYLHTNAPRQKTLSRDKPSEVKANIYRKMAQTSPGPGRINQNIQQKPYTIPRKNSHNIKSKSPNQTNQYKKYTAPNQLNIKGKLLRNQQIDNKQKWNENLIKDQRSKQLMKMDDFTIPHKAMNCMTKRIIRTQGNQRIKTVRKIFTMRDGTQEIHENVFVERIDDSQ